MRTTEAARGRWHEIFPALGINCEAMQRPNVHHECPLCNRKKFRLTNRTQRGDWICTCGHGDGVDLVREVLGLSPADAMRRIDEIVGRCHTPDPDVLRERAEKLERFGRIASRLITPTADGSVSRYLASRFLSVPAGFIKEDPFCAYFEQGSWVRNFPAMVAPITSPKGIHQTLHLTYLDAGHKAPVSHPKKILPALGPLTGGAIRLAPAAERMGIAEGIETALAASVIFKMPVWAAYSADMLKAWQWPDQVRELLIFSDNDLSHAGQAAAFRLAQRASSKGLAVSVELPENIGDWADVLYHRQMRSLNAR